MESLEILNKSTREIAIAFCACLVGKKVILYIHRDPIGFLPKMLMMQLKNFQISVSSHFKRPINLYDKDF